MGLFSCGSTRDYLKDFGYGTISLPREGIKPLMMMIKNGDRLTPLGPLASTFQAGGAPMPVPKRQISADVTGSRSRSIDLDLGLNILGTVIGALSGSSLGLKAAYKNSRKVEFEFGNVMEEKVDVAGLDSYLSSASVATSIGNFVKQALDEDKIYVIVSTLDATQVSVEAKSDTGTSVGLDVPVIQQIVGAKVAVSGSGASNSKITYSTTTNPLSFGLQVVRLIFDGINYTTLKTVKPSNMNAFVASTTKTAEMLAPALTGPGIRIEI